MRRAATALLLCAATRLCVHAPPLSAQTADAVLDRAIAAYQRVTTLKAGFTQRVTDPMIGTDETSRGEFYQRRPKFAMRFTQPVGDEIVSDGQTLWVYLPSSAPHQVIRSAIGQGTDSPDPVAEFLQNPRERFAIAYVRADSVEHRPADVLSFTPKAEGSAYRRVLAWIDRKDGLPHAFEITESAGTIRRVTFDHIQINARVPGSTFAFNVPSGARVVDATQQ